MGVVIEVCIKYPGGPTRIRATDINTRKSSRPVRLRERKTSIVHCTVVRGAPVEPWGTALPLCRGARRLGGPAAGVTFF
jgi:hypothetical protein